MRQFAYTAVNAAGSSVRGVIEAENQDLAADALSGRGLVPLSMQEQAAAGGVVGRLNELLAAVSIKDLIIFTKQFRTMFVAGVSLTDAFRIMEEQAENPRLKTTVRRLADRLRGGASLHEAFSEHPKVFPPLYRNMIRAGELSGALGDVLERLTYLLEHELKIRTDIKSAMRYPTMVILFLIAAFVVLLTFVIPQFEAVFNAAKVDLPMPTRVCIGLSRFLLGHWPELLGGAAGLYFALRALLRSERGLLLRDKLLLRLPLIGPVNVKATMSRFANIFAILQASGVTMLEAFDILAETIGNRAIMAEFRDLKERVQEGRGIAAPLKGARHFTPMVVSMVAIGEETGRLDDMLREVTKHYDVEVEHAVARLAEGIGPMLVLGLAVVVGFFALAIYMPMWDMAKVIK